MKCPYSIRTTKDIRDELERRGVCKISRARVGQILRQAERKILEALRSELCR